MNADSIMMALSGFLMSVVAVAILVPRTWPLVLVALLVLGSAGHSSAKKITSTARKIASSFLAIMTGGRLRMAQELRHEILRGTIADGTTSSDAMCEFRNDSSRTLHIRELDLDNGLATAAPDEGNNLEISKAPTMQSATNNSPFFTTHIGNGMPATGATPSDGELHVFKQKKWGRGQLTLEPNESLFMNGTKTSGGILVATATIGYEFG